MKGPILPATWYHKGMSADEEDASMCIDVNGNLLGTEASDQLPVMVPVEFLKELIELRTQFLNVLDLQSPDEGHSLKVLRDEDWVNWPSFRLELFKWMTAAFSSAGRSFSNRLANFPNGDGWLAVSATHLVDDYWWIECRPSTGDHPAFWTFDNRLGPATAVLRFRGSRKYLIYSANTSPRITPDS